MGLPVVLKSFDELAHSIRTGRPSIELSDPDGLWGHLAGAPAERAVFSQAMTAKAAGDTAAVLAAHDFSAASRNHRHWRRPRPPAARRARGDASGTRHLFDLSEVVEAGGPAPPRLVQQAGDFFVDPLPAGSSEPQPTNTVEVAATATATDRLLRWVAQATAHPLIAVFE
jgi:hypothetical protein